MPEKVFVLVLTLFKNVTPRIVLGAKRMKPKL